MSSNTQSPTIITYINSKGQSATYDKSKTGVEQKIGQADARILAEKYGIFPYGKNEKTGKPYLNACGGKKRDESQGWFKKGDWCEVKGCMRHKETAGGRAFDRKYPKAEHYKATCVGGSSAGKLRDLGASTGVSLAKVAPKKKSKFFQYLTYALEARSGNTQGKTFAFVKATEKIRSMCDSALGKVKVSVADIKQACVLYKFKGADGKEVSNDTSGYKETTAKQVFIDFYKSGGHTLYEVEEEEDSDDEDDFFTESEAEPTDTEAEPTESEAEPTDAESNGEEEVEWCDTHEQVLYNKDGEKCSGCLDDEAEEEPKEEPVVKIDGRTKAGKALKIMNKLP